MVTTCICRYSWSKFRSLVGEKRSFKVVLTAYLPTTAVIIRNLTLLLMKRHNNAEVLKPDLPNMQLSTNQFIHPLNNMHLWVDSTTFTEAETQESPESKRSVHTFEHVHNYCVSTAHNKRTRHSELSESE